MSAFAPRCVSVRMCPVCVSLSGYGRVSVCLCLFVCYCLLPTHSDCDVSDLSFNGVKNEPETNDGTVNDQKDADDR